MVFHYKDVEEILIQSIPVKYSKFFQSTYITSNAENVANLSLTNDQLTHISLTVSFCSENFSDASDSDLN